MRKVIALTVSLVIPAIGIQAQQAEEPGTVVRGVAVDSVRSGVLSDAIVRVVGSSRSAVTDSSGRFRIAGVPAGTYRLEIFHPLIDTLALLIRTGDLVSTGSDSSFVALGIPSPATIVALKCTAAERSLGGAMALGIVSDAESEAPAEGASVFVEWIDFDVRGRSITETLRERSAQVTGDGSYRICGIPDDLLTVIGAARAADTTALLPVNFESGLVIVSFRVPPMTSQAVDDTTHEANGVVHGRVLDPSGSPLENARVSAENDGLFSLTAADGSFRLAGLRAGTRSVTARKIGFTPVAAPVDVRTNVPAAVDIRMERFVPVLETVRITAVRELGLQRVGFTQRKRSGMGRYMSPEDIQRRNPLRLNDLIRNIPPLRMVRGPHGEEYLAARFGGGGRAAPGCVRYFLDGHLWPDMSGGPDSFLSGSELGAVEVYSANSAPAAYTARDRTGGQCASVVIWTKWKLRI